jgi:hypothetical protein
MVAAKAREKQTVSTTLSTSTSFQELRETSFRRLGWTAGRNADEKRAK